MWRWCWWLWRTGTLIVRFPLDVINQMGLKPELQNVNFLTQIISVQLNLHRYICHICDILQLWLKRTCSDFEDILGLFHTQVHLWICFSRCTRLPWSGRVPSIQGGAGLATALHPLKPASTQIYFIHIHSSEQGFLLQISPH